MNINYAFYSDELLADTPIARPDLYKDVMDADSAKRLDLKFNFFENFLINNIISKWHLYADREEMSFFLLGSNPRNRLFNGKNYLKLQSPITPNKEQDKSWMSNKPYSEEKIRHWVEVFNVKLLNDNNLGFWFFKKTAAIIKENNIKLIAFLTPINGGMIEEYDLMRHGQNYSSNMEIIKAVLAKNQIPLHDYSNIIDLNYFNDLFHMIASGNKRTASILFNDMNKAIAMGVSQ